MAEYVGSSLYLKFGTTELQGDFRSLSVTETIDIVDASAGSDTHRTHLGTLESGQASVELVDQAVGTAVWAAVDIGTSGTLEWGPEGTATGKPKHTVTAIVTNRAKEIPYDDIVTLTVDFEFSDASGVVDTVY